MKIKAILELVTPKTYTGEGYFTYTDTETGKRVSAQVSAPSNMRQITFFLNGGNWEGSKDARTYVYERELGYREFSRQVKELTHVGSNSETMADFIRIGLIDPNTQVFGQ